MSEARSPLQALRRLGLFTDASSPRGDRLGPRRLPAPARLDLERLYDAVPALGWAEIQGRMLAVGQPPGADSRRPRGAAASAPARSPF